MAGPFITVLLASTSVMLDFLPMCELLSLCRDHMGTSRVAKAYGQCRQKVWHRFQWELGRGG